MNKQTALLLAATLPLLAQRVALDPAPKHLIAFMGDSFAAGEGAPSTTGGDKWLSEPCHRSEENGRARAAQLLGALVPNRTVFTANGLRTIDDFHLVLAILDYQLLLWHYQCSFLIKQTLNVQWLKLKHVY